MDESSSADPLVAIFMPPLLKMLFHLEKKKGAPLTEDEVLAIRDQALCMKVRASAAAAMAEKRGYLDISPEDCWKEWQTRRAALYGNGAS